jgi:hypothetical protein
VFPLRRERTHPSAVTDSTKRRLPSRQPRWVRAPGWSACADTHDGLEKRQSEAHWQYDGPGPQTRRRARVPQRAAGTSQTPRAVGRRPAAGYPGNAARRGPHGVLLTCTRICREPRPPGHAAGPVPQSPWARDPATHRAAVPTQRGAGPANAPARAPTNAPLGVSQTLPGAGLRGFRAR